MKAEARDIQFSSETDLGPYHQNGVSMWVRIALSIELTGASRDHRFPGGSRVQIEMQGLS